MQHIGVACKYRCELASFRVFTHASRCPVIDAADPRGMALEMRSTALARLSRFPERFREFSESPSRCCQNQGFLSVRTLSERALCLCILHIMGNTISQSTYLPHVAQFISDMATNLRCDPIRHLHLQKPTAHLQLLLQGLKTT